MISVGITGAGGRMGRSVIRTVSDDESTEIGFAVNRSDVDSPVKDVDVYHSSDFDGILESVRPDCVIDFTGPKSMVRYVDACADRGVPFVTGTTGISSTDSERLAAASRSIPVLHAPNFSRGVNVLERALEAVGPVLESYDVELIETHHNRKLDAPSGTAKRLLERIGDERTELEHVHGRHGDRRRKRQEVGVHSVRAGDIAGEHEIIFANNHEEIRFLHRAQDRGVFAVGALDAAKWIVDREPGRYDFTNVIEETL